VLTGSIILLADLDSRHHGTAPSRSDFSFKLRRHPDDSRRTPHQQFARTRSHRPSRTGT
jgi:hypothetical protein